MKKNKFIEFIGGLFSSLLNKEKILKFLEEKAIKAVLKKFLIVGGWKAWLIKFVVGELIEEADEHLIEPAFRKVGFFYNKTKGHYVHKKNIQANDDDWSNTDFGV